MEDTISNPSPNPRFRLWLALVAFVIVALFFIPVVTFLIIRPAQKPVPQNRLPVSGAASCRRLPTVEKRDGCFFKLLREQYDSTVCDQIEDVAVRDACWFQFALAQKRADVCLRIDRTIDLFGNVESFADWCMAGVALRARDVTLCDGITGVKSREICWLDFPAEGICPRFTEEYQRNLCWEDLAEQTKDVKTCERIVRASVPETQVFDRSSCYGRVAAALDDETICGQIGDSGGRDFCYEKLAGAKPNQQRCRAIADATRQAECLRGVAAAIKDITICDQEFRDWAGCYGSVAAAAQQPEYCNRLSKPDDLAYCYRAVGGRATDSSVCAHIPLTEWRDHCYYEVARKDKNPAICMSIGDSSRRNDCELRLTSNPQLCLNKGVGKNSCLTDIAEETGESSVCEFVDNSDDKIMCYVFSLEVTLGAVFAPNDNH